MQRVTERLLLRPAMLIGMFAALALGGAALARSSGLLGLASLACLLMALWSGLWLARSSSSRRYGVKEHNPRFFSSTALQLSWSMGEKLLWESRQHPLRLWRWGTGFGMLSVIAVTVMATVDANGGLLLWTAGLLAFGARIAAWRRTLVCVTNRQIVGVSGLFKRRHVRLPIGPHISSQFTVDPAGRRLAQLRFIAAPYGTLEFRSTHEANQGVLRIAYVTQVAAFAKLLRGL